jgi:hypothetical protein
MACQNQRVAVTHPSREMFIGGQESFGGSTPTARVMVTTDLPRIF